MSNGWIGVDLDGTLAHYDGWKGGTHIGDPIPAMVQRVKNWKEKGRKVKIFTARADREDQIDAVKKWCKEHLGYELEVTNKKDFGMVELWDDRCVRVIPNTGKPCWGA